MRDLRVLQAPDTPTSDSSLGDSATSRPSSRVTDSQAQKLFWVMQNGDWSLQLRPKSRPKDSPESVETLESMLTDGLQPAAAQVRNGWADEPMIAEHNTSTEDTAVDGPSAAARLVMTGSCEGLAELRDAIAAHPELELRGWCEEVDEAAGLLARGPRGRPARDLRRRSRPRTRSPRSPSTPTHRSRSSRRTER